MITHVLWFFALMLCAWLASRATAEREQAKHAAAMATMRGEFTTLIGREREASHKNRVAAENAQGLLDELRCSVASWEKRFDAEHARILTLLMPQQYAGDGGGDDDHPMSVTEADRLAVEEERKERAKFVPVSTEDDDSEPPYRVEADDED